MRNCQKYRAAHKRESSNQSDMWNLELKLTEMEIMYKDFAYDFYQQNIILIMQTRT